MSNNQEETQTILIVEDDEATGDFFELAIAEETPYHAHVVINGEHAIRAVLAQRPCLIILDYHLPDMTGIELYDQFRTIQELDDVPMILMSASQQVDKIAPRDLAILNKPFDLDDFIATIERFIAPVDSCPPGK